MKAYSADASFEMPSAVARPSMWPCCHQLDKILVFLDLKVIIPSFWQVTPSYSSLLCIMDIFGILLHYNSLIDTNRVHRRHVCKYSTLKACRSCWGILNIRNLVPSEWKSFLVLEFAWENLSLQGTWIFLGIQMLKIGISW